MSERLYSSGLPALFEVVHRLRSPGGCPWDREQTHESLRPFLLEEAYEAVEAIDVRDDDKLLEELGDVLLQVAMHAEIASEEGRFDAARVSEAAAAKMVARHPHVFGDAVARDAEQVLANWEHHKAREAAAAGRSEQSIFDRVPRGLPAIAFSAALQSRAARVGLEDKELSEPRSIRELLSNVVDAEDEASRFRLLGDLLFAIVALARVLDVDAEDALRVAARRFTERMRVVESSRAETR